MPTFVDDDGSPWPPPRLSGTKQTLFDSVGSESEDADRAEAVNALLQFRKDYDASGGNIISLDPSTVSANAASTPAARPVVVVEKHLPPSIAPCSPRHRLPMSKKGTVAKKPRPFHPVLSAWRCDRTLAWL